MLNKIRVTSELKSFNEKSGTGARRNYYNYSSKNKGRGKVKKNKNKKKRAV